jgi:RecA/RadA recombinase
MFIRLIADLRTSHISAKIIARHMLKQSAPLAYTHPLENTLFDTLRSAPSGVFVHWGAYGSGKTTAAKHAALRLQAEGRTVILLHGFNFSSKQTTRARMLHGVGTPENAQQLSPYFSKRTTIIVDHFDHMMQKSDNMLQTVRDLIDESNSTKRFNVLLVVRSWELACDLREVGCTMAGTPSRWTRDELLELYATLSARELWTDAQKEAQIQISTLSGTPDFIQNLHDLNIYRRRAVLLDAEWRNGTKALAGAEEMQFTVVGRFPDKKGIFHWEDVATDSVQ